jgi:porphyrinogen peroxidase
VRLAVGYRHPTGKQEEVASMAKSDNAEPQPILSGLTEAAMFLVLTVDPGHDDDVRDSLAAVSGLVRSVGFRSPIGGLTCVVGLGSQLWDRLFGVPRPAGLHPFVELHGPRKTAVATPGDLLFHIRGHRFDFCFELAERLMDRFVGFGHVVDEVHGFKFFDERDLLGFVDGTENPVGAAAVAAALIGEEDPSFAGGSYVIVQKYVHDLASWDALSVEEQERAIGRSKLEDIEMADDVKPSNSHVALNTIVDDNGEQRQIVRVNMPFGSVGEKQFGTYYIAYARNPDVIEQMLANMFIGSPRGNTDRILDFSTPLTGSLFFVPSAEFLDAPPGAGEISSGNKAPAPATTREPGPPSGSLGIGSLKGAAI